MAIPPLQLSVGEDAVLPEGIHPCEERDLLVTFVKAFPNSRNRLKILVGFLRLRADFLEHEIYATQWVDGSFVTGKPEPEDVDVVAFVYSGLLDALSPKT